MWPAGQESWHPCLRLLDHVVTLTKWFRKNAVQCCSSELTWWSIPTCLSWRAGWPWPARGRQYLLLLRERRGLTRSLVRVRCAASEQHVHSEPHLGPVCPVASQTSEYKRWKPFAFIELPSREHKLPCKSHHCCFQTPSHIYLLLSISAAPTSLRCLLPHLSRCDTVSLRYEEVRGLKHSWPWPSQPSIGTWGLWSFIRI